MPPLVLYLFILSFSWFVTLTLSYWVHCNVKILLISKNMHERIHWTWTHRSTEAQTCHDDKFGALLKSQTAGDERLIFCYLLTETLCICVRCWLRQKKWLGVSSGKRLLLQSNRRIVSTQKTARLVPRSDLWLQNKYYHSLYQ